MALTNRVELVAFLGITRCIGPGNSVVGNPLTWVSRGQEVIVIKLYLLFTDKLRVVVPSKPFQPSLTFVAKSRALSGAPLR